MGRPKKITPIVEKAPPKVAGAFDILPEQQSSRDFFLEKFNSLAHTFGYVKMETPLVEDARLFRFWKEAGRGVLFEVADEKGNKTALKPGNLFGLARSYLENHYFEKERTCKWNFCSPVAYLKPQHELKQNYEWGFQIFGETSAIADVQLINLLLKLFSDLNIGNVSLEVNNIGCLECQPAYAEVLRNYFKDKKYDLCEECLERLETYPLGILGCSNLSCSTVASEAPVIVDYLCEPCRRHFIGVLEGLDELGVVYNLNQKVINSPWSRRTAFELRYRSPENQEVVLGTGGHADDLIQSLGGPVTAALGFSSTIETIVTVLEMASVKISNKSKVDVFLVPLGELAAKKTLKLFTELWSHNIVASEFIGPGSIKTQLKLAESNKVNIALIIGQKEAREGTVILRDVPSGMQELFTTERIIDEVKKRLGK
jgi:histidyl-tRNA synthetase